MFKRLKAWPLAALAGLILGGSTAHAIPSTLTLQGFLTNSAGAAQDGSYTLTISLWTAETGGSQLYTQTLTGVSVADGLFDVLIGLDPLYPGLGPDIFKNNNNVFMQVELDAGPGVAPNEAPLPRRPLAVSPFAFAAHHANSATSATTANTATTASVATNLNCSTGCVSVSELAFDVATQAELDAALVNLVTTSNLTTTLQDYVKSANLATTLQGYVSQAALATELAPYITTGALTTALSGYVTLAALNTALSSYATTASLAAYVKTADLTTLLASYAKTADLPTSVNGLAGGTITSAVSVSGELSAPSIKQGGNAVCDTSGNCGTTLTQLSNCTNNQVATFVNGAWACTTIAAGGSPADECKGAFKALQWTGSAWSCVDVRQTGLSTGKANGFEVVDDWGFAWDGIQRGAKTYAEATTLCADLGARLPLATELFRNNATTGTGNLGDISQTSYLWTQVPFNSASDFYLFRLSDGGRSNATANTTVKQAFRCVWPDYTSTAFDGDYCNGKPGESCFAYGDIWNVDSVDRAPLFYNAAQYECNFHNASLLEPYQFHDLGQLGIPNPTANYLWGADVVDWYINYIGFSLYRFNGPARPNWQIDDADVYTISPNYNGSQAQNYNDHYAFRCIGKKAAAIGKLPSNPGCKDGCFTVTTGRRFLLDSTSRDALNHNQAAETCRLLGADLPSINEFTEAVHAGWGNNNDNHFLWINEPIYYYSGRNYYPIAGRMDTNATTTDLGRKPGWRWAPEGNTNASRYTVQVYGEESLLKFRCVWRETLENNFRTCAANENQVWANGVSSCVAAVDGDSGGQANPNGTQLKDAWGNAWDTFQRTAATFEVAKAACETAGGRLPTPTEVYRVRVNQSLVPAIGDSTSTSYLWTLIPDALTNTWTTIRVSDGSTTRLVATSTTPYRCIWPTTKGDSFTGRSCYGAASDPCFTTGHTRLDRYDRAPVTAVAAMTECRFFGGRLAGPEDYMNAIHAGLPNGSQSDLWMFDQATWYSDGRGYSAVRWNGTGDSTFTWKNNAYRHSNVIYGNGFYPFRCVYTDEIR